LKEKRINEEGFIKETKAELFNNMKEKMMGNLPRNMTTKKKRKNGPLGSNKNLVDIDGFNFSDVLL